MGCRILRVFIATCALCFAAGAAVAQDSVAQFYRGKTINILVGSPPGGGYDGYARLLARHLGKHIPGNPSVIPQNMPGAGSNKATGFVALQAPKDGATIGAVQPGAILAPLLSDQKLAHDPSKLIMLGSATNDVYLCLARSNAAVKSFKDTFSTELIMGTSGQGATLHDMPAMLVNLLGAKLRLVGGYNGSHDVLMAMERNEVQGICGMGWSSISMQHPDWIKGGFVRILAQEDLKGQPEVNQMGVPLTIAFAKTEEDRQVMQLMYSQSLFGRPYVLPPGVPAERVEALRKAFMATLQDKELLADAAKSRFDINPMAGDELQALVAKLYALPPQVITRAKRSLIYKPASK